MRPQIVNNSGAYNEKILKQLIEERIHAIEPKNGDYFASFFQVPTTSSELSSNTSSKGHNPSDLEHTVLLCDENEADVPFLSPDAVETKDSLPIQNDKDQQNVWETMAETNSTAISQLKFKHVVEQEDTAFEVMSESHVPTKCVEGLNRDSESGSLFDYQTGIVVEESTLLHCNTSAYGHVENPGRVVQSLKALHEAGLLEHMVRIRGRQATFKEIARAHDAVHLKRLKSWQEKEIHELKAIARKKDSLYLNNHSVSAAQMAAGSAVVLTDAIISGKVANGLALIRPPGHHADCSDAQGFCLINNVAVAAAHALEVHKLKRILIVDWDVHFGNGTESIFRDDPRVIYFSVHRDELGAFYPHKKAAQSFSNVGHNGTTINVGWSREKMGDGDYLSAFFRILMPIAYELAPELVLVSAGFDAAHGDPLGNCSVTPEGYANLLYHLKGLAKGKIGVFLEGGYHIPAVCASVVACSRVLLGKAPAFLNSVKPSYFALRDIYETQRVQGKHWESMKQPRNRSKKEDSQILVLKNMLDTMKTAWEEDKKKLAGAEDQIRFLNALETTSVFVPVPHSAPTSVTTSTPAYPHPSSSSLPSSLPSSSPSASPSASTSTSTSSSTSTSTSTSTPIPMPTPTPTPSLSTHDIRHANLSSGSNPNSPLRPRLNVETNSHSKGILKDNLADAMIALPTVRNAPSSNRSLRAKRRRFSSPMPSSNSTSAPYSTSPEYIPVIEIISDTEATHIESESLSNPHSDSSIASPSESPPVSSENDENEKEGIDQDEDSDSYPDSKHSPLSQPVTSRVLRSHTKLRTTSDLMKRRASSPRANGRWRTITDSASERSTSSDSDFESETSAQESHEESESDIQDTKRPSSRRTSHIQRKRKSHIVVLGNEESANEVDEYSGADQYGIVEDNGRLPFHIESKMSDSRTREKPSGVQDTKGDFDLNFSFMNIGVPSASIKERSDEDLLINANSDEQFQMIGKLSADFPAYLSTHQ